MQVVVCGRTTMLPVWTVLAVLAQPTVPPPTVPPPTQASVGELLAGPVVARLGGTVQRSGTQITDPIVAIDLTRTFASDADLGKIPGLDRLETLDLSGTNVSDGGLETLE